MIPKYFPKRNISIIKNYFEIDDENHFEKFNISIYYLDDYKCKIIIRTLYDLDNIPYTLKIYSLDKLYYESILIDNIIDGKQIIESDVYIRLYKTNQNIYYEIPKIIVQTGETYIPKSIYHMNSIFSFIDLNPEFEYIYFNNSERRQFIKKYFRKDVLEAYDSLIIGAFRADIFRYCYMYINGGCYHDYKQIMKIPYREWMYKYRYIDNILCYEHHDYIGYYNAILLFKKNNKNMYRAINTSVDNVLNKFYWPIIDKDKYFIDNYGGRFDLEVTSPYLLGRIFGYKQYDLKQKNIDEMQTIQIISTKKIIIMINYKTYYTEYGQKYYYDLWKENIVYYNIKIIIADYIVYIYTKNPNDVINIRVSNKILYLDNNLYNYIKIINDITNKELALEIKNNEDNKIIDLNILE